MRINLHIEIDDSARRALRHRNGHPGLATEREVQILVEGVWESYLQDVLSEYARNRRDERTSP